MRYSRQVLFKGIGKKGQKVLGRSTVAIAGCGALGSRAAELLARAGIGSLVLIDRDVVELSNLQRQALFDEQDVGRPKAIAAKEHLEKINSEVKIEAHVTDLCCGNVSLLDSDLILGCTDNMQSRFLINEYALKNRIPWVHGGAIEDMGNLFVTVPGGPCFRCIFPEAAGLPSCDTVGITNTITTVIAAMQSREAVKLLLGQGCEKSLVYFYGESNSISKIGVRKNPRCPACRGDYPYLSGQIREDIVKLCGTGTYQIKGSFDMKELRKRLSLSGKVTDTGYSLIFRDMQIFRDKRVLIRAKDEKEAKAIYSRYIGN